MFCVDSPVHESAACPLVPDSSRAHMSSPAPGLNVSAANTSSTSTQEQGGVGPAAPPQAYASTSTDTSTFPALSPAAAITKLSIDVPAAVFLHPPPIPFPSSNPTTSQTSARDPASNLTAAAAAAATTTAATTTSATTPAATSTAPFPNLSPVSNPFSALSQRPVTLAGQHAPLLGQRKKGQPRKHRRSQRARGVLGWVPAAPVDGAKAMDGAGDQGEECWMEESMEEDMIQDSPNDQQ